MNDRIEHPQVRVPFLKRLGKLLESCRSPFTLRRLAAAVVLVADLEDDLMEKPLLLALFNVPIPSPVSNSVSWHPARQIEIVNIHAKTKAIFFIVAPPFLLILTE